MKLPRLFSLVVALSGVTSIVQAAPGHDDHAPATTAAQPSGQLLPASAKDAAWVAKAKAEYPTSTCVVSDDKLGGDMGKAADFIYREEGKPDRLVSFCCKDCVKDFQKDPQKYLKMLDDAAAGKKSNASSSEHQH